MENGKCIKCKTPVIKFNNPDSHNLCSNKCRCANSNNNLLYAAIGNRCYNADRVLVNGQKVKNNQCMGEGSWKKGALSSKDIGKLIFSPIDNKFGKITSITSDKYYNVLLDNDKKPKKRDEHSIVLWDDTVKKDHCQKGFHLHKTTLKRARPGTDHGGEPIYRCIQNI